MKTLKQFIFEKLDKGEYILDQDLANFLGKEVNYCTAEAYKGQWRRLKADRNFFKDIKALSLKKGHRCYMLEYEKDKYYKIGKDYYEEQMTSKQPPASLPL